ncbi:hypothetical protein [Streptomyces akebiae]|uniref:Uncharacterized protein n=1 Tax=Streptomyces akebiae TaxID=2865673 RepID=A0ABX8XR53_9ACTN|nr:hypothetical protein [Streptomyces akebiae]QYX77736.1 hypothetical protein K1J60_15425 [Streptomyces akebiae]
MDAFAGIEHCAQLVIIVDGSGLVPVPPDAAEGFCCLVCLAAAATGHPRICV